MDYLDLVQSISIASEFETHTQVQCKKLLEDIETLQQGLKSTSLHVNENLMFHGYEEITAEPSPSKDDNDEEEPSENQPLISTGINTDSPFEKYFEEEQHLVLASLREEIFWEIDCSREREKVVDSKIFFFASLLWRLSFGENEANKDYYYMLLSPAETLIKRCRLLCEFRIHCDGDIYSRCSGDNYEFPGCDSCNGSSSYSVDRGFSSFVDKVTVERFVSKASKLLLSAVLTTDIADDGELVGYVDSGSV